MSQRFLSVNIYMENQNITIADLDAIRNIINVAATRGAFRAEEMLRVGEVYNKLNGFLESVVQQAQQQAEQEAQDQASQQIDQSQGE